MFLRKQISDSFALNPASASPFIGRPTHNTKQPRKCGDFSIYRLNYDIFILRFYSIEAQKEFAEFSVFRSLFLLRSLRQRRRHDRRRYDKSKEMQSVPGRSDPLARCFNSMSIPLHVRSEHDTEGNPIRKLSS